MKRVLALLAVAAAVLAQQAYTSIPMDPPQPQMALYQISALATVPLTDLYTYMTTFNVAPPYDQSRPIQKWAVTNADPSKPFFYNCLKWVPAPASKWDIVANGCSMPGAQAATLNIYPPRFGTSVAPPWPATGAYEVPPPLRLLLPNERFDVWFGTFDSLVHNMDFPQPGPSWLLP